MIFTGCDSYGKDTNNYDAPDYESTFEQLLIKNKTITSHKKNLHYLAIEIYKTFNGLNPPFMDEIFSINQCPYYLRNSKFKTAEPHYKIYGFNTVSYRLEINSK